jgi:hypothetical protein
MTWNARNAFRTGSIPALECIAAFMERQGYMMWTELRLGFAIGVAAPAADRGKRILKSCI